MDNSHPLKINIKFIFNYPFFIFIKCQTGIIIAMNTTSIQ